MYLAMFVLLFILIAFVLMLLLYIFPVKVSGEFNSERQSDIDAFISWIGPLLTGIVTRDDEKIIIKIKLFGRKIYVKDLNVKRYIALRDELDGYKDYVRMLRALKIDNGRVYASYGFSDPAITGVLCGVMNLVSQYIDIDEFYNDPDFIADNNYFNISARAEINGAISLVNIIRRNRMYLKPHVLGKTR